MLVIDYKNEHWKGLKDYQYMRPKTLFIPGISRLPAGCYSLGCEGQANVRTGMQPEKNSLTFGGPDKAIQQVSEELNHEFSENSSAVHSQKSWLTNKEIAAKLPEYELHSAACSMPTGNDG
jgi:hypothetical protein